MSPNSKVIPFPMQHSDSIKFYWEIIGWRQPVYKPGLHVEFIVADEKSKWAIDLSIILWSLAIGRRGTSSHILLLLQNLGSKYPCLSLTVPPKSSRILDEKGDEVHGAIGPFNEMSTLILTCDVQEGKCIKKTAISTINRCTISCQGWHVAATNSWSRVLNRMSTKRTLHQARLNVDISRLLEKTLSCCKNSFRCAQDSCMGFQSDPEIGKRSRSE